VLVLQGNAATKLRCGGKFFILVISYFILILTVKEFLKSTNICQSYSKNKSGPVFSDSQCSIDIIKSINLHSFREVVQCSVVTFALSVCLCWIYCFILIYLPQDDTDRGSTIYRRVERRWLGGIKIPFTTIYINGRVCLLLSCNVTQNLWNTVCQ